MKKLFLLSVLMLLPMLASADAVEINGIYYNLIEKAGQAEVTMNPNNYTGIVVIPESVIYEGKTYSVTSIGNAAFYKCSGLTSVTIPNSVTFIGKSAFSDCSGLTSVTIPNSVTYIGYWAFGYCSGLTSVTIPNSVTSIGEYAFHGCSGLTSVHITDIAAWCKIKFDIVPSNPLYFAHHLYLNGEEVKDLVIPNSVTSIGSYAFSGCSSLTSVTIPNSVTSIGERAFADCTALQFVKTHITEPYSIYKSVFPDEIYRQSTLYVPAGTEKLYSRYDGWREFLRIVEMDGTETPDNPGADKCATPTISYQFGQLSFSCETEGVTFVSEITDYDIKKSYDAELYLTATYYISVCATKDGYENSDVATATLSWMDAELFTDDISGGAATVRAKAVLIQSRGSMLSITGADEGTAISVYDVSGKMVGSATAASENTHISTSLRPGDIALVKIGNKTIKVVLK